MLPPEARATLSTEYDPPALVDESFAVSVVTTANNEEIRGGLLAIDTSDNSVDGTRILSADFAPMPPEGVRSMSSCLCQISIADKT